MRDKCVAAAAPLVLLVLFLYGVRVRVETMVATAVRAFRVPRKPPLLTVRLSTSDLREEYSGILRSAVEYALNTLGLLIIISTPWMLELRDRLPPNALLAYTVAAGLAFGRFIVRYDSEKPRHSDLSGVLVRIFVTIEMVIVTGVCGMESIATAATNGTFNILVYLVLLGWVPFATFMLVIRLTDWFRSFLGKMAIVVAGLLAVAALVYGWSGSYFIGVGAAPADMFEGSTWEMLSGIIVTGMKPPTESVSRGAYLAHRVIVFAIETVVAGVLVSKLADSLHRDSDTPGNSSP